MSAKPSIRKATETQRNVQGMAATFGIEVETKGGRSRLKESYSELSDNTVSDVTVSDDSSENDEDDDKEENVESPSKGPQRKKIRKVKNLTKVMLQATEEGKERDEWRQEAKEKAAAEVGAALVLKAPAENVEEEQDVVVPEHMSAQLQPHQRVGVQFVWECCVRESRGAILAHCMGLGKTFQMITVLQCVWQQSLALGEKWKLLVLAPVNVIRNWEGEYQKFMPDSGCPPLFTMVEAGSLHEDRVNYLEDWHKEGGIMLMGYEQFRNIAAGKNIRTKGKKFAKNIGIKERYQKALLDPGPYMVVCDEGHILRRETSEVTRMVGQIKTQRRIVLSGTPLQNNLMEYHCMVDFVRPGLLGTAAAFKRDFVSPILNGQCMDSTAADVKAMRSRSFILNHLLKGVVDRADFKVLQPYLRPKHEFIIGMRLSALQVELYRSILKQEVPQLSASANGDMLNKGEKIQNIKVLGTYHKLAKVWSHPRIAVMKKHGADGYDSMDDFLDDEDEYVSSDEEDRRRKARKKKKGKTSDEDDVEESEDEHVTGDWLKKYKEQLDNLEADSMGKMLFLSKLLKEASVVGDKVLVFSQSLLLLDLIEDMLELAKQKGNGVINSKGVARHWQLGVDYFRLDGGTNGDKRRDDIDKFNKSSKARLYLISTKAGSLGVNMAAANRVVLMDASWNPSYDQQAIFRAYRFGQEKECFIYRLLAHGTMEQKIYGRQVTKQALSSRVVDSEETGRHFSSEELNTLFEFTPGPTAEQVAAELAATCLLTSGNKEKAKVYNLAVLEDEGTGDVPAGDAASEVTPGMPASSSAADPQVPAAPAAAVSDSKAGPKEQKSQGNR
jgi:transcriptional regulator ATRX